MKADYTAAKALNVIFWKVICPFNAKSNEEFAEFILAELRDKNLDGLTWNIEEEQFETESQPPTKINTDGFRYVTEGE